MRAKTLQVVWHDKKPIFSLDFHPSGLLATGGGDNDVKLWKVLRECTNVCSILREAKR